MTSFKTFDIFEGVTKEDDYEEVGMLPNSFAGLVIGKPGSGKSTLIENLLLHKEGLYHKFNLVLFMAPYEIGNLKLYSDRKCDTLNISWIYQKIEEESKYRRIKNCLVIIDDLVSSVEKDTKNQELVDFIFNRRKIAQGTEISILFTTQKYTLFPARFRATLQFIIFFNIPPDDYKVLSNQQIFHPAPHLKSVIDVHFKKYKHNFVFIRLDKYGLFLNFNKQI